MSGNEITPSGGFINELGMKIKVIVKLMGDKRVSPLVKLIPVAALVYLISPLDIIPLNPLDDAGILGLGFYLFLELCPPDVVAEHMDEMRRVIPGEWRDVSDEEPENKE